MAMADPYGTGDGGLLGGFQGFSPLTNFGLGLLAQSGPSLTPQSPFQAIGRAAQYTTEAQQQAMQNALYRQKLTEGVREAAGQKALAEAIASGGIPLPQGMDKDQAAALFRAAPEAMTKAYAASVFPAGLDPKDKVQMALVQAQLLKLQQEIGSTGGETVSEPVAQLGNISTIAESSERLDKAGSIFTPGGIIEKFGGLDSSAAILTGMNAAGVTDLPGGYKVNNLLKQVTDAQTVSKATAALAQSLQGASGASSRSAYALRNIQTALGQSMIWPAKRRILVQNLKVIFADTEAQPGLKDKIPGYDDAKNLYDKLSAQDEAFTKGGGETGTATQAATPPAPQESAPGNVPGFSMMPPAAEAAPAAPPAKAVKTQSMMNITVPGVGPVTAAQYPRVADGQRAVKTGEYFIAPDENGQMVLWQK
jgi:hypothetical protein